jgi:hypothetical protein
MPAIALAIGATTLGSSVGQRTHHIARPPRIALWIVAGLMLGALLTGIGVVSVRQSGPAAGATAPAPRLVEPPEPLPPAPRLAVIAPDAAPVPAPASLPVAAIELEASPTAPISPKKATRGHDHAYKSQPTASGDKPSAPGDKPSSPAHPAAATPKPTGACGSAVFAAVYDAVAPSASTVRAALRTLRSCHDAGEVTDIAYEGSQRALVSKL